MEKVVIDCACGSNEHILIFSKNDEEDYRCVYLSYHLQNDYWYKRIWKGIKYIFGFKSKYGNFGETIIDKTNVDKLSEIVKFIKSPYTLEKLLEGIDENNLHKEIEL